MGDRCEHGCIEESSQGASNNVCDDPYNDKDHRQGAKEEEGEQDEVNQDERDARCNAQHHSNDN